MRNKMRAVGLAVALTMVPAGSVFADECGIGSKIWAGRDGWIPWLAAFTTNFWTFKGISTTFEIAGCHEDDNLLKKLFAYTNDNMDHLAVQMARGEGEHLDALATLLEVRPEHRSYFGIFLQDHFVELVAHDDVTAGELLTTLGRLMAEDETLAAYVQS